MKGQIHSESEDKSSGFSHFVKLLFNICCIWYFHFICIGNKDTPKCGLLAEYHCECIRISTKNGENYLPFDWKERFLIFIPLHIH